MGYESESGRERNLVNFEYKPIDNHVNMQRSRRELSVDMVVHRGIFKNNHITLFLFFTFMPKKGLLVFLQ